MFDRIDVNQEPGVLDTVVRIQEHLMAKIASCGIAYEPRTRLIDDVRNLTIPAYDLRRSDRLVQAVFTEQRKAKA